MKLKEQILLKLFQASNLTGKFWGKLKFIYIIN